MVVTIDSVKSPHGHYPQFSHQSDVCDVCDDVTSPVPVTRATDGHTRGERAGPVLNQRESDKIMSWAAEIVTMS